MKLQLSNISLFQDHSSPSSHSINHPIGYINAPKLSGNNQSRYEKAKRIKARWANGKIRVKEIPQEAIDEMKDLKFNVGLSYESIAKIYGLSRYMVVSAVENTQSLQKHFPSP